MQAGHSATSSKAAKLPLILFTSLIIGYCLGSTVLTRPGDYGTLQQSTTVAGPPLETGPGEERPDCGQCWSGSGEGEEFVPHKYHALNRACNLPRPAAAKAPSGPKAFIHVLGERHSGTNAMEQLLSLNFNVRVGSNFTLHKHFMQPYPARKDYSQHLLVLTMLNVYDWSAAMRRVCYHCEGMESLPLPDFLTTPVRSHPADVDFFTRTIPVDNPSKLQGSLAWRQVDEGGEAGQREPTMYRMRNGTVLPAGPFPSFLAMRALKVCQVLDLALRFGVDLEIVRQEDFLFPHQQVELVRQLHNTYQLPLRPAGAAPSARPSEGSFSSGEDGNKQEGGGRQGGEEGEQDAASGDGAAAAAGQDGEGGVAIRPLGYYAKAQARREPFDPGSKVEGMLYFRGTLGVLGEEGARSVAMVNALMPDWGVEQALGYTPILT